MELATVKGARYPRPFLRADIVAGILGGGVQLYALILYTIIPARQALQSAASTGLPPPARIERYGGAGLEETGSLSAAQ
jgi:hypothetical protein